VKRLLQDLWEGEPVFVLAVIRSIVYFVALIAGVPREWLIAMVAIVESATAYYTRSRVSPV